MGEINWEKALWMLVGIALIGVGSLIITYNTDYYVDFNVKYKD